MASATAGTYLWAYLVIPVPIVSSDGSSGRWQQIVANLEPNMEMLANYLGELS